jgi:hypothetical protein
MVCKPAEIYAIESECAPAAILRRQQLRAQFNLFGDIADLRPLLPEFGRMMRRDQLFTSVPTVRELLDLAVHRIEAVPVLTSLITFRPEFTPPWIGHAHVTLLTLRLKRRPRPTANLLKGNLIRFEPVSRPPRAIANLGFVTDRLSY